MAFPSQEKYPPLPHAQESQHSLAKAPGSLAWSWVPWLDATWALLWSEEIPCWASRQITVAQTQHGMQRGGVERDAAACLGQPHWKRPLRSSSPKPHAMGRLPLTSSGCPGPHPNWPCAPSGMGHSQLFWVACASASVGWSKPGSGCCKKFPN